MGGSRAKRLRFFEEHPHCCFCGGLERATERDHVPGRQFFRTRDIPTNEFVFPACAKCNLGTRISEIVAACYFRMRNNVDQIESREIEGMLRGLKNNAPLTFDEIAFALPGSTKLKRLLEERHGPNDLTVRRMGMNSRAHLERFSAKLALAMHYKLVKKSLPEGEYVYINLRNNLHFLLGAVPPADLPFGLISQLEQGSKTSFGQFEYRYVLGIDFEGGAFQANFNNNWVITMITAARGEFQVNSSSARKVFRPRDGWRVQEVADTWSLATRREYAPSESPEIECRG